MNGNEGDQGGEHLAGGGTEGRSGGADLARAALAAARARARRIEEGKAARRRTGEQQTRRSGARPDDRDPQPLEATLARLLAEAGWEAPAAVGGIIHGWADIVGPRIAAHCVPVSFQDGVLTVQTDSSAWATELRNLSSALLAKLNAAMPRLASAPGSPEPGAPVTGAIPQQPGSRRGGALPGGPQFGGAQSGGPQFGGSQSEGSTSAARDRALRATPRDDGPDDLLSLVGDTRGGRGGNQGGPRGRSHPGEEGSPRPGSASGELRGAIRRIAVIGPHPPSWRRGGSPSGGWSSKRG